jgi:signal transduction histidine kinase/ActR/RegA family two-component response regulator
VSAVSRPARLHSYLVALITLGTIPPLLLAGWLILRLDREYRHGSRQQVLQTARALSDAVDAELRVTTASLENLAGGPALDGGDVRTVGERLSSIARMRGWTTAALLDGRGRPVVSVLPAAGAPSGHADVHREVLRTGQPAVSGLVAGHGDRPPALHVAVPVVRDATVQYVFVAGVPVADLKKVLATQWIPTDWRIGVNDRRQVIVASNLEPDPFVGQPVTAQMVRESSQADEGWFPNVDKEGRNIYAAFHRSPRTGLVLVMNVPREAVDAPANRSLLVVGVGGFLLLGGGLAAALVLGHRLAASVLALRDVALAVGRGESPPAPRATHLREVAEARKALDGAAGLLAVRAAERGRLLAHEQLLRAEAERTARLLQQVQLIADTSLYGMTPDSLMRELLASLRHALTADTATLLLLSEDRAHFVPAYSDGLRSAELEDVRVPVDRGVAGRIAASGTGVILSDLAEVDVVSRFLRDRIKSLLGVPVKRGEQVIGVIHVGSVTAHAFTPHELTLLRLVADRIGLILERAGLYETEHLARQEAEAASRAKDDFLTVLSHELRNPLAAITSAVAVLNRVSEPRDATSAPRRIITRQTRHLTRLVADLLDVSRLSSGKVVLRRGAVDVADAVRRCVAAIHEQAEQAGIELSVRGGPAVVEGDPARLEQVVTNLVENAVNFTPRGGRVEVVVGREGSEATLVVRDTGMGIDPALLTSIFHPFIQGTQPPDRVRAGLGIGLAVVKRLTELHGGTVSASSRGPGSGSEFTVRLPLLEANARPAPPASEVAGPASRSRRVLVIEDHADNRNALTILLEEWGHHVEAVEDGTRGLERLLAWRPDIALVDVGLPGLDGYAVARAARAAPSGADLYLVALTGYGQPEDRRRGVEAGFDDYVVKPIDVDDLRAVLARVPAPVEAADTPSTAPPAATRSVRELVTELLQEIGPSATLVDVSETPPDEYSIRVDLPGEVGKAIVLPRPVLDRAVIDLDARATVKRLLRAQALILRTQVNLNDARETLASSRSGVRCMVCSQVIPPGEAIVLQGKAAHPSCWLEPTP